MPTQDELIGAHPAAPNIFEKWLACDNVKVTKTKCHRSLTEVLPANDKDLLEWFAKRLIHHHYDDARLDRLKKKFSEVGFPEYAKQHRKLPIADMTKKGNATEVLLVEYIQSCQNKQLINAYKLRYNPNVDQAMKGDDVLIVDIIKEKDKSEQLKVFLGESKFRKTPTKTVVDEISDSLKKDKLPLSYSFLVDQLNRDKATQKIADLLDKFLISEIKAKNGIVYAGFLLSDTTTSKIVEANLKNKNTSLVFISAGINNPENLINDVFVLADKLLLNPAAL